MEAAVGDIEVQWQERYQRPVRLGKSRHPTTQRHVDWWVENLEVGVTCAIHCGAVEALSQPKDRDLSRDDFADHDRSHLRLAVAHMSPGYE